MPAQSGDNASYGEKNNSFNFSNEIEIENRAIKGSKRVAVFVRGLPNSGKTSMASMMQFLYQEANLNCVMVEANDHVYHPPGVDKTSERYGKYIFNKEEHAHCWQLCLEQATDAMADDLVHAVIVSNTFTTKEELQPFLAAAKKYGRRVISFTMDNLHGGDNKRGVPMQVVQDMADRFEQFHIHPGLHPDARGAADDESFSLPA